MSYQINNYEDLKKTYEQQFYSLIKDKINNRGNC